LMGEVATDWMDTECPEAKRLKVEEPGMGAEEAVDCRQWTQHHLVAADIRVAPAMALTPPQGDADADGMDVNVRGPDSHPKPLYRLGCPHGRWLNGTDPGSPPGSRGHGGRAHRQPC
ncbi:NOTCH3 isoform 6, partial [Pongo abelii]